MNAADTYDLQRFLDAQQPIFDQALSELRAGRKQSHWMWFVFPQIAGLGRSPTAMFYAIRSEAEARAYLAHEILGSRLRGAADALLPWAGKKSAEEIFGPVDAMKLRSSLTLFDAMEPNGLFMHSLGAFFDARDEQTLALLNMRQ